MNSSRRLHAVKEDASKQAVPTAPPVDDMFLSQMELEYSWLSSALEPVGYPTACWLGFDLWVCLGAEWCWSKGDERPGDGLVQQYYTAHSWSIVNDGIVFQESASNGGGDLVWCLLGNDVHQSLHCLCDHS